MAEQNPSTQPAEKAVEAPQTEAHQHAAEGAHAHTGSEKKQAIKEALKPQARRTSVVEDYSAELDEMASLTRAPARTRRMTKPRRHGRRVTPTTPSSAVRHTRRKSVPCRLSC